eukprot:1195298-Prorocentrum_minimum.AAC.3
MLFVHGHLLPIRVQPRARIAHAADAQARTSGRAQEGARARRCLRLHARSVNVALVVKCPYCDLQVEVPEEQRILRCPRESCGMESCKLCGEPPHIPLRCDEVEKAGETRTRLTVEEHMTQGREQHPVLGSVGMEAHPPDPPAAAAATTRPTRPTCASLPPP